jgi:hypothetical protein
MATTTPSMGLTAKGVPKMPLWLTIVRGAAIALSLGALIAAAYNVSLLSNWIKSKPERSTSYVVDENVHTHAIDFSDCVVSQEKS